MNTRDDHPIRLEPDTPLAAAVARGREAFMRADLAGGDAAYHQAVGLAAAQNPELWSALTIDHVAGLLELRHPTLALQRCDEYLREARADHHSLRLLRAEILYSIGDHRGADAEATAIRTAVQGTHDSLSLDDNARLHRVEALVAADRGDLDQAAQHLDAAQQAFLAAGNLAGEQAIHRDRLMVGVRPGDEPGVVEEGPPQTTSDHLLVASALKHALRYQEAIEVLRHAVGTELDPALRVRILSDLTVLYRLAGQTQEAERQRLLLRETMAALPDPAVGTSVLAPPPIATDPDGPTPDLDRFVDDLAIELRPALTADIPSDSDAETSVRSILARLDEHNDLTRKPLVEPRQRTADNDVRSVTVSGTRGSRPVSDLGEDIVADPAPIAVVLTAIAVEHEAVREHLLDIQEQVHQAGTIFHLGRLPNSPWRIVLTQTGQGNPQAAALAERAISHYRPDLVMFVGVAGRLHTDLSLGDVVAANKVYAIHGGKEDDDGFRPRPESWWPDHHHVQRAERIAESDTWQDVLPDQLRSGAKAVVRAIASGEVVLDSVKSPHARMIKRQYDDAAAIEMEGAGVALASQLNESLPVVVLRGISDHADGQKDVTDRAGWQQRAARNAAAFAVTLLAELAPTRPASAPEAARAVEEDLLFGTTDQQIAAVHALGRSRDANAVSLLARGFDATLDSEVSCRIIWALGGLGTVAARDALQALNPRYDIERLMIRDALEAWREQPQRH